MSSAKEEEEVAMQCLLTSAYHLHEALGYNAL